MLNHLFVATLAIGLATCHHQSVIIIGAGSSGIAAATHLLTHNVSDITILEAEDRIGGRVHTVPCGDHNVIEMGAEWVTGKSGNIIYDMMKEKGLLSMLSGDYFPADMFFSNGETTGKEMAAKLFGIFVEIYSNENVETDKGLTSAEQFVPAFKAAVDKEYADDRKNHAIAMKTLSYMEHLMNMFDGSFSWTDSSAITPYEECENERTDFFTTFKAKGFQQLFDIMSGKIPETSTPLPLNEKIHFNKVVSKINYSNTKPVVTCTDGSEYTADVVLFTPSLGVLKHDHESIFEPSLPEDKISAINDLGFDGVFKVVMHFNNPWWTKDTALDYNFVFTREDEEEIAGLFADGPMKNGRSWITSCFIITTSLHNPNVITAWFSGPNVPEMEEMSDAELRKGLKYVFKKFLGGKFNVTRPDKLTKSDWYKNPHFRGMATYETLKSQRDGECAHMTLAKPLKNNDGQAVLLFAGEATNMKHYATVHGAIESGYREADRIMKMHNDI